jgi:Carboxypeptidase regulatory-like domain/TonB-dependent Receptor Plug Domain
MKTSIQKLLMIALMLLPVLTIKAQDQNSGDLKATVNDEKGIPMYGAVVRIVAGASHAGGQTDENGNITFRALSPGAYDVEAYQMGFKRFTKKGILVNVGQTAYVDFPMQLTTCDTCNIVEIWASRGPLDPKYSTLQNLNADQARLMPKDSPGDIVGMVVNTCSSCSEGTNGGLVMRGSRENATAMFVDGERMYGQSGVPGGAIDQVTILSGGIPASYGDLTGGAIIVTTKSYYSGIGAKQSMYEKAAEEKALQEKENAKKAGTLTETNNTIIVTEQPADSTAPAPQPVPADGNTPAPKESPSAQPAPAATTTAPAEKPKNT